MAATTTPSPAVDEAQHKSGSIRMDEATQRAMDQGRINLANELARLRSLGILDENGELIDKSLPDDMKPGADRDFGG